MKTLKEIKQKAQDLYYLYMHRPEAMMECCILAKIEALAFAADMSVEELIHTKDEEGE